MLDLVFGGCGRFVTDDGDVGVKQKQRSGNVGGDAAVDELRENITLTFAVCEQ